MLPDWFRTPAGIHLYHGVPPFDAQLTFAVHPPCEGDRSAADAFNLQPQLYLVVETKWLVEISHDMAARIPSRVVEQPEPAHQCRLRRLRPAKGGDRLEEATGIDIPATHARLLDVFNHSHYSAVRWARAAEY
jgi:hypothetical protein